MSRRNAKLAIIHDLQCKHGSAILTKKDLSIIVTALRTIDKSNFTKRDNQDYNSLLNYLVNLTY